MTRNSGIEKKLIKYLKAALLCSFLLNFGCAKTETNQLKTEQLSITLAYINDIINNPLFGGNILIFSALISESEKGIGANGLKISDSNFLQIRQDEHTKKFCISTVLQESSPSKI